MATEALDRSAWTIAPVVTPAPIGPLEALAAVEREPGSIFFDSADAAPGNPGWTLLAFDPLWRLEVRDGSLWRIEGSVAARIPGDPIEALSRLWPPRLSYSSGSLPPFASGLAGFVSYDFKDHLERFPRRAPSDSALPDLSFGFYDVVWAWDSKGTGVVVSTGLPERDAGVREKHARERLDRQLQQVMKGNSRSAPGRSAGDGASICSNFTREEYRRAVKRALEYIAAGDIYQVNLAQRFQVAPAPDPGTLYRTLRRESPAPFASFLTTQDASVLSSSPERFFRIRGDRIETWPIKGTRPRGATEAEDRALASALVESAKDRAENVMIVDLERNDLGRICDVGSVRVSALCDVAHYAHVHHLVSRVEGTLGGEIQPVDVLRAMFPGGSITGAPKIRAVEIIDELEPTRRGVYTGAIGYWDVSGDCDFNIAIRTVVVEKGVASFHAGGAIVADSTPDGEYEETLVKARGMMRALGVGWKG